jgi:hypothetical protein
MEVLTAMEIQSSGGGSALQNVYKAKYEEFLAIVLPRKAEKYTEPQRPRSIMRAAIRLI